MANMAIEAGAKNGIFPVDEKTKAYLEEHSKKEYQIFEADEDAEYEQVVTIDLSEVRPTVAFPHLPGNAKTIDEIEAMEPIKIDQVVIGSCRTISSSRAVRDSTSWARRWTAPAAAAANLQSSSVRRRQNPDSSLLFPADGSDVNRSRCPSPLCAG